MTYIFVAQMLAVFNIDKAVDEDGNMIDPDVHFISGVIRSAWCYLLYSAFSTNVFLQYSHPSSFNFSVSPRSERSKLLIESAADNIA